MNDKIEMVENWRWKIFRKLADFIHQPDDITTAELTALINSYRNQHELRNLLQKCAG